MAQAAQIRAFLNCKQFAVVGASTNRQKFGNKVFRALLSEKPGQVTPVNPKAEDIEGVACIKSPLDLLKQVKPEELAVSIITPPTITTGVVQELLQAGVRHIWMQPGAESPEALAASRKAGVTPIAEGPCVLVQFGFHDDM